MRSDKTLKTVGARMFASGLIVLSLLFTAECATAENTKVVGPGSMADIHFLCRLRTGEVVAATDTLTGWQAALPKSPIFLLRDKDGPVSVQAAGPVPVEPHGKELSFEAEIIMRLSAAVVGMKEGEKRTVSLTSGDIPERRQEEYGVSIARVRVFPKEKRMSVADYRSLTGKTPEEGQPVIPDPVVSGRVKAVTPDEVTIGFSATPGDITPTPFGPGHIRETDKAYEIVIDARKGALVRTGHLVGRITDVTDQVITIDYRNPFGGETLLCDVSVEKVRDKGLEKIREGSAQ